MPETARTISLGKPTPIQSPPCDLWPGDVLAQRYKVDSLVGWGGQAVVFRATDLRHRQGNTSPWVAIKVVRSDLSAELHREAVTVLRWEARLLRNLRHASLPRAMHFHSSHGHHWLVRELITGTPLSILATQGQCTSRQVLNWAVQVCDLLSYLHTRTPPVICGDIKPANLVLQSDGKLILIDLGAAQTRPQRPPRRPRPRHGTPGYASPEQMGTGTSDERSDVFNLAATCYELLTGDDPTVAPLQFDLQRLNLAAPTLAPALRWALTLDAERRAPTAAALRSALTLSADPEPLRLGWGVTLTHRRDLVRIAMQHPGMLENAITKGMLERWLVVHPDRTLGQLLHDWRIARRAAAARQQPLDILLTTLAPEEGSPLLRASPEQINFDHMPLRQWRIWSPPQRLTLHNTSQQPLCWELECPAQPKGEVRVLVEQRPLRQHSGVLLPTAKVELLLVAAGRQGPQQGTITLRCGQHVTPVTWQAVGQALLPVGNHLVARLEELDLARPDLVPTLEALLRQGLLRRWLYAQGKRTLAAELDQTDSLAADDTLRPRLLVARILHQCDPERFPWLDVRHTTSGELTIPAGQRETYLFEIENLSNQAYRLKWNSHCRWAYIEASQSNLPAHTSMTCEVALVPPLSTRAGSYRIDLELQAANLIIPITFQVQVLSENWWNRMFRWLVGNS